MMRKRYLLSLIREALSDSPVVLLNGARQVGKSTLVQYLAAHEYPAHYITFDDLEVLSAAQADPAGFIAGLEGPVILDEIQRVTELFLPIKATIDRLRKPGRFLLTGSANVLLLPKLSESLAGRMEILTLWPLSQGEINEQAKRFSETFIDKMFTQENTALFANSKFTSRIPIHHKNNIISRVIQGGYPEMLNRTYESRRKSWFKSYITTILQRDVKSLANIEGLTELPHLLALLSARTSSLLNYAELSRTTGLPQTTLKRYMTLLEMTFLVQLLPAWSTNLSKRLVKSPKIMLNDTGLAAYLMGMNAQKLQQDPHALGQLFETFAGNEIRKQIGWSKIQPQLFHFRSQAGMEVDIVLEDAEKNIVGIEIKAKNALGENDFKGLRALAEIGGKKWRRGILFYFGQNIVPIAQHIHAVPINTLWE